MCVAEKKNHSTEDYQSLNKWGCATCIFMSANTEYCQICSLVYDIGKVEIVPQKGFICSLEL